MLLLAIRFLVELLGVAALAFVGATVPGETLWRVVLGIGAPLALVVVWALLLAPRARSRLSPRTRSLLGTAVLVGVAGLLVLAGQPVLGVAFAAVVVVDEALVFWTGADDLAASLGPAAAGESD